jgi:hypothetical protein
MAIIHSAISSAALAARRKVNAKYAKCPSKNIVSFPLPVCENGQAGAVDNYLLSEPYWKSRFRLPTQYTVPRTPDGA